MEKGPKKRGGTGFFFSFFFRKGTRKEEMGTGFYGLKNENSWVIDIKSPRITDINGFFKKLGDKAVVSHSW